MAVSEPGNMEEEEQNRKNGLQFSPLAINWIANNSSGLLGNLDSNLRYIMTPGSNGIHLEPVPIPPWMHCQPTPQNYVEFLAERGYPEIQKSYNISTQVPSLGLADPSQLVNRPNHLYIMHTNEELVPCGIMINIGS